MIVVDVIVAGVVVVIAFISSCVLTSLVNSIVGDEAAIESALWVITSSIVLKLDCSVVTEDGVVVPDSP